VNDTDNWHDVSRSEFVQAMVSMSRRTDLLLTVLHRGGIFSLPLEVLYGRP